MSVSKTIVIGHLGKDADIKQVNGKQVMNFSIAHSTSYTNAQGVKVENTQWFECAYWSESKVGAYLLKSALVCVEGEVSVRAYPKNDGTTGISLMLRVFNVNLLAKPKEPATPAAATGGAYNPAPASQGGNAGPVDLDNLPF